MTWHVPEDDAISTVATARSVGGGSLILVDGSNFGASGWPKLVVIRRGVPPADTLITVLEFSGRSGNTLTGVATSVGHADAAIQVGDTAFLGPTKCHIVELQDAIDALSGTVTTVSVVSANGVSGSVATATTTPAITLTLGTITPTSIVATGNVSGTNLSGTNTGDQVVTLTGDITGTGTGSFATTIGSGKVTNTMLAGSIAASKLVGSDITIAESQVTSLTADLAAKAPLASPALTGTPTFGGSTSGTTGLKASATASGTLTLPSTTDTLATQTYVTSQGYITGNQTVTISGDISGTGTTAITTAIGTGKVTNAMLAGSITATKLVGSDITIAESQVTGLIADLVAKAPLSSPTLIGTPTAPTASNGTNTTQIATTAFVLANVGGGAVSSVFTRTGAIVATSGDYTVSQVTGAAPLASPALTGTPTYAGSSSGTTGLKASATASGTLTLPAGTDTLATQTYVTSQGYLTSNQTITLTGDITGSGTGSFATTIGATKVTNVMLAGSITAAKLVGSDITITESQVTSLTADLSSKAPLVSPALTGTPTFSGSTSGTTGLKASATASGILTLPAGTDTLATQTYVTSQGYLTSNQTITLTGDVGGSGTGSFATTIGAGKVTNAMLAGSITAANLVGSDITITESQVTSLTTDLSSKAPLASPALTGTPTFSGSTSGTTILKASAIASGTLTLPASTDTLATQTYVTSQGYITNNQTITLTGDVTGTGTGSFATTIGATKVTNAMLAGSIAASKLVGSDITIAESQVTSLTTDLAAKAPLASPTFTGKATISAHVSTITADTDGATITFDCNVSDWHSVTLGGNRTLVLSNDSTGQPITVMLTQDGTGSRTVTWWSGIKWPGGTTPTLTTTTGKIDVFTFKKLGAGSYLGFVAGQNL